MGGPWTEKNRLHINCLELLAVFLGLRSFVWSRRGIAVLLLLDNILQ